MTLLQRLKKALRNLLKDKKPYHDDEEGLMAILLLEDCDEHNNQ